MVDETTQLLPPQPEARTPYFPLSFVVLVALLAGLAGYFLGKHDVISKVMELSVPAVEKPIVCTDDAKVCPDGSAVGRSGPNCEFTECPVVEEVVEKSLVFTIPESQKLLPGEDRETSVLAPTSIQRVAHPFFINGEEFQVSITPAGGGPCPNNLEDENYSCNKVYESFPNSSGLNIWKDSTRGVFALNTMSLIIEGHPTDVLMVAKKDGTGFTASEVEIWKEILSSIKLQSKTL